MLYPEAKMAFNRLPPPNPAVTPTCQACGQTVFCGGGANPQGSGPNCPSSTLPLPPDQVVMVLEQFQNVTVWNYQDGQVTMVQQGQPAAYDVPPAAFDDSVTVYDSPLALRIPGNIIQVA